MTLPIFFFFFSADFSFYLALQFHYKIIAYLINTYYNFFFVCCLYFFFSNLNTRLLIILFFFIKFKVHTSFISFNLIPSALLLGYNVIHPVLFYFSIIFGIVLFTKPKEVVAPTSFNLFIISTFCLLLGGLWGVGNSTWNFFWVKDSIEVILLLFVFIIVFSFHISLNYETCTLIIIKLFFLICVIFLFRWGFSFTRHNFFNIKSLVNIFISYSGIPILLQWPKFSIFLFIGVFYPYLYLVSFLLSKQVYFLNKYKFFLIVFHLILFVLSVSWVKFRENTYHIANFNFLFKVYSYNFSTLNFFTNYFYLRLSIYKFFFLNVTFGLVYNFKLSLLVLKLFISYLLVYFWYVMLISIHKIYVG